MSGDNTELNQFVLGRRQSEEAPTDYALSVRRRFLFPWVGGQRRFVDIVAVLRWVIPMFLAFVGAGYILFEEVNVQGHFPLPPNVIRTVIVIGLVGPTLAWILLTWATDLAMAEARIQAELARRSQELAVLNAVGQVAVQSLNIDEILQKALEETVEIMDLESGEIRIVEDGNLVLSANYKIEDAAQQDQSVPLGSCICSQCVKSGQAIKIDSPLTSSSRVDSRCALYTLKNVIAIPLKTKHRVLGVMLLAGKGQKPHSANDERILTAIGYRIAGAVDNAQLYRKARRRAIHLETASLTGQRMTTLLEFDSLLREVVRLIREKFNFYHVHLLLVDRQSEYIVLKEASGPSADLIKAHGIRLKIGKEGITGWVAHTGQTLVCNDVSREPRYLAAELVPDTRAELAVPLRIGNQIIGVLDVQSNQMNAFDKEDVTVLQILGNQVGIAIRNSQLYQETKHRYEAMMALHETSLDMIGELDTKKLLVALLRRGTQLLGAQAATLFVSDNTKSSIQNVASYNTWQDNTGMTVQWGEGVVGQVIMTGKPLIVNDYENWPLRARSYNGSPQSKIIGVPLRWHGQIIGALDVLNDRQGRDFNEGDTWLLGLFADLATLAVKNADLHTQVKESHQELERKVLERTEELSKAKDDIATKIEKLRYLLGNTIDVQEEERARIARDMHDSVIQLVSAARMEMQAALALSPSEATAGNDKINTALTVMDELEKEIRRAIYDLHPPILDVVGIAPALAKYIKNYQKLLGFSCELQVNGAPYRLPPEVEIAVFRLVEEALNNVSAHADAENACVTLDYEPSAFCVMVQDNGQGFDYTHWIEGHHENHLGLFGMRERIENLGGAMKVNSGNGHGTQILFELPIVQDEE